MDQGFELISPILKILEIDVSNILYNPGNIKNLNLCFAVEPPRRGFFFRQKQHFFNFWTCPISGNSTFPGFWSLFGSYLALFGPY